MNRFLLIACACVLAAQAVAAPSPVVKAANERLAKIVRDLNSRAKKGSTTEIVAAIEAFRRNDPDATNAEVRAFCDGAAFDMCSRRESKFGFRHGAFESDVAARTIETVAKRVFADAVCTTNERVRAADYYSASLADGEKYDEAAKMLRELAASAPDDKLFRARILLLEMKLCRWQEKPDEMVRLAREACALNPKAVGSVAPLLVDCGLVDETLRLFDAHFKVPDEMSFYTTMVGFNMAFGYMKAFGVETREKVTARVRRFVRDETIGLRQRFGWASWFGLLTPETPEAAADRAYFESVSSATNFAGKTVPRNTDEYFRQGNWRHFAFLMDKYAFNHTDPRYCRAHAQALAYLGREADALKVIARGRSTKNLKPLDAAKYAALESVLKGEDACEAIDRFRLQPKERADAYSLPAKFTLNLMRNEDCHRYAAAYRRLFKAIPRRRVAVKWFGDTVDGIEGWRRVRGQLEKSYVDVKMCGDLENLETDVATGRKIAEKTALDREGVAMEVTTLCDVRGLHVYLAVEDVHARQVEAGFAGGLGTEMYFAPGDNRPYWCFGTDPRTGVNSDFRTAYATPDLPRLGRATSEDDRIGVRSEVQFTDRDYVCHIFFPWEGFFRILPAEPGTEWKLECLCWGNGCSWGGAQGIHESSSWGRLVFNLTPAQLSAIRRRLILSTFRTWDTAPSGICAPFERWADPVIGDPAFYEAALKPLQRELADSAARVKSEMTDAEVDEIFEKGAKRWMALPSEIDIRRRRWLLEKNFR